MTQAEIPLTDPGVNPANKRYAHPRPPIHWIVQRVTALCFVVAGLAIVAQVILALLIGPLLLGTAFFTAVLMLPLLMQSVLHPEVITTPTGFTLQPLGRPQFVQWEAVQAVLPHPLIYNDVSVGKHLRGKHYQPREGALIVVSRDVGLSPRYQLISSVVGLGGRPAFAISSTTHTDYTELLALFRAHAPDPVKAEVHIA